MLTLKTITENKDEVIRRLAKKHFNGKEIIALLIYAIFSFINYQKK